VLDSVVAVLGNGTAPPKPTNAAPPLAHHAVWGQSALTFSVGGMGISVTNPRIKALAESADRIL